jgi:TM2 domain-containing membrane protein YozV
MKIFHYLIIISIVILTLSAVYAGENDEVVNQYLIPSALSDARLQMMQNINNHLVAKDCELISFLSTASDDQPKPYKDRKKALLRSLIIPGAGEYYLGKKSLARAFFATEVTLWLGYFAFQQYGKWVRQDALAFAATHSGAKLAGKPSQFFVDIGNYTDVYQYNDAKLRYGENEKYYAEADYFWSWDQDSNRQKFENMRIASDRARNRSTYVLGAVFANHLISAIHASWQTHRYNKKIDKMTTSSIHINVSANYLIGELSLQIQKEF